MTADGLDFREVERLADTMFAAIQAGDIDAVRERCYAPEALVWHNYDRRAQSVDENLRTLRWVTRNVADLRYEEVRRQVTATGFVQQHVLRGVAPDDTELEVPACLVVTVTGDRIGRIDEYLDTSALGPLSP
jgi:ketosteroid isomerase-like protein